LQSNKEKEMADKRAIPKWKINVLKLRNINIKQNVLDVTKPFSAAKL